MSSNKIKKIYVLLMTISYFNNTYTIISTKAQNDPLPYHSALYPFEFLNQDSREKNKGLSTKNISERVQCCASFVSQVSTTGTDKDRITPTPLGDIHGRWNMIGLLYGNMPINTTQPTLLATAAGTNFSTSGLGTLSNIAGYDQNQQFGFFSAPMKYQKLGCRIQFTIRPITDLIFRVSGGIIDLQQLSNPTSSTTRGLQNQMIINSPVISTTQYPIIDQTNVTNLLMDQYINIFKSLNLDADNYRMSGLEDISLSATLRHSFEFNKNTNPKEWAQFTLTPFLTTNFTIGNNQIKDPSKLFAIAHGNNGHNAITIETGANLDFYETIEVGCHGGATHFFNKNFNNVHVPTHILQSVLYPYATNINIAPNITWYAGASAYAYHIADNLSMFATYDKIIHQKDTITLLTADPAFVPSRLEDDTTWDMQMISFGCAFDLAPTLSISGVYQTPLASRATYKTHNFTISAIGTF